MSFTASCSSITIKKGVLSAQCKKLNGTSVPSSINLNDHIEVIDSKLVWGGKGFISSVQSLSLHDGVLTATFDMGRALVLKSTLNLNDYIKNSDGVLEAVTRPPSVTASPRRPTDIKVTAASGIGRALSSASTISTARSASASSIFSTTSSVSSATTVSSASSSSTFTSSHFRKQSKHFLIQETCTNIILKGTFLHADCRRTDGFVLHSSINLDEIIGLVGGRLEWDRKHFSKDCFEFALDGFMLAVKFRIHAGEQYSIARLDLRTRLRNANGTLVVIELNNKLSVMLSEVPWMKFKVIAEPDFSVFAKHPVMQETLVRIAETTVEHVTNEMHKQLTIAMESAISIITASAMSHVQSQMEALVMDVAGQASASASITGAESLHLLGQGRYGFSGYAAGGFATNGFATNGYYGANGHYAGGVYAQGGDINGNGHSAHIVSSPSQSPAPHASKGHAHGHGILAEVAHAAKHILHLDHPESVQHA